MDASPHVGGVRVVGAPSRIPPSHQPRFPHPVTGSRSLPQTRYGARIGGATGSADLVRRQMVMAVSTPGASDELETASRLPNLAGETVRNLDGWSSSQQLPNLRGIRAHLSVALSMSPITYTPRGTPARLTLTDSLHAEHDVSSCKYPQPWSGNSILIGRHWALLLPTNAVPPSARQRIPPAAIRMHSHAR
ncbi:hypothetical protein N658DRAFT_183365 [Parathielavia hyrcaniae]|uniref:Uncharacterized protein n=1 Tax=Parathielavia hyrcaniae TaxID=113614 RepID=A0AAN6Q6Q8_9PEZI|nr:hypothetical protein N658DRAFT_183365 [Parathielavia hyrcaniae]